MYYVLDKFIRRKKRHLFYDVRVEAVEHFFALHVFVQKLVFALSKHVEIGGHQHMLERVTSKIIKCTTAMGLLS